VQNNNSTPVLTKKDKRMQKEIERKLVLERLFRYLDTFDILNTPMVAIDFEAILTISKARAYPCEIGLVEFTLSKGELQTYHSLLDSRPLPSGHQNTINFTKLIHGIDATWYEPHHRKYTNIWNTLCDFVGPKLLLARDTNMEIGCLNWLASKVGTDNTFQIFEVENIMEYIHQKFAGDVGYEAPKFKDFIGPETGKFRSGKCSSHKNFPGQLHCALGDARLVAESVRILCARYSLVPEFLSIIDKDGCEEEVKDGWGETVPISEVIEYDENRAKNECGWNGIPYNSKYIYNS